MEVEKLVKAIKKARDEAVSVGLDRITVPFKETDMILELLRKQQPMNVKSHDDFWLPEGVCPSCYTTLDRYTVTGREQAYCAFCGQAVNWNEKSHLSEVW